MSDDGDAVLADWIARLRRFGAEGLDLAAREAQPLLEAEVRRTAAAGTDPYGTPWPARSGGVWGPRRGSAAARPGGQESS